MVEKILIHKLDKIVRVHRACGDSGQNEAERTNSAIGDALVTGETLNWEYHTQFENMSKEEIEALTLQDYERLEKERMEKNAWRVASELAERVDGEPAPHGFISCQVTPKDYEQFYSDQEYMSAYISASSESAKKKLPGHGYYSMIDNFYKNHCQKGELYIEFLKGSCQKLDEECCKVCLEWSGPATSYVPRPYPDYSKAGYHYMPARNTPIVDQHGKPREIDDFQPRAQLRKLYCNGEISSSDEVKIHECREKYIVDEVLVRSFILHLEHLDLLKRKREKQQSEKKKERNEKSYEDYNWKQLYETRQIKGLKVFELDRYITKHKLTKMKLKKHDKVALVDAHIGMTVFKELANLEGNCQEEPDEDDEEEDAVVLLELGSDISDEFETSNDDESTYCICRGPDDGRFMICCDVCNEWYHGQCVGMENNACKEYVDNDIPYICPFCEAN